MKLWDKGYEENQRVDEFTVGNDRLLDLSLAKYDVQGSIAHITMLESIGLITPTELTTLHNALKEILTDINNGKFTIEDGIEDVHSEVEYLLTKKLGDIGKKIHSGRSRNDQVLVDLKLFMREEIKFIAEKVMTLFNTLQATSDANKDILMPGYTHMQIAMPSSFGLWFGAYAETLIDDMQMLLAAHNIANQNPLGSAAGYGSSFPINRQMTTELLNFQHMHYNVVAAQMSRGKTERSLAYAIASVASTIGKFAMDACLFMSQNYAFISLPDELTTGSSIMPHKKNPDVFEIIRGKCNRLQAIPNEVSLLTTNLPLGYQRDLQLLKDIIFSAIVELKNCIDMTTFMVSNIQINKDILSDEKYDYLFTVEDVNQLVINGMPFRDAYKTIGMQVQNKTYKPTRQVHHTHQGSIGNLCTQQINNKMQQVYTQITHQ